MGSAVNKVILIGNLGKDPEVRYTPSGQAVANFTLATSESWNDKQGQRQDRTEWHRIVTWGKTAELCGEYLSKGRQVYLEGKLQTRSYDDKDGKKVYTTEIVANTVQFIGSKDGNSGGGNGGSNRAPQQDHGYPDAAPVAQVQPQAREPQQHAMAGMDGGGSRGAYPSPPTQQGGGSRHSYGREAGYDDVDDAPFHHEPRSPRTML